MSTAMDTDVDQVTYRELNILEAIIEAISEQAQYSESAGHRWERFGGAASFVFSRYGLACVFMAMVLNRTTVFASAHNNNRGMQPFLPRNMSNSTNKIAKIPVTALLRLLTIIALIYSVGDCLVGLKVILQNAPDASSVSRLTRLIPDEYFNYDVARYAQIPYMDMPPTEVRIGPTSAMLWRVFLRICYLFFVENFIAAINGRKANIIGSITLLELSVNFNEVSNSLFSFNNKLAKHPSEGVLILAIFVLADHITYHIGCFLYQNKYRLIPQAINNVLFLIYFVRALPTGFIPVFTTFTYICLTVVWALILVCSAIALLAVLSKGTQAGELQFATFFRNEGETSQFFSRHIGCSLSDDFYTASMNLGLFALTSAGKSSYITQYNYVNGAQDTWIEQLIWKELCTKFNPFELSADSRLVKSGKVLSYLKKNKISGYNNVINVPSPRLVNSGGDADDENRPRSTIRHRFGYLKEIIIRFVQLLESLVFKSFILTILPRLFNKYIRRRPIQIWEIGPETDEEFRSRKLRAPKFVQQFIKKREASDVPNKNEGLSVKDLEEDELEKSYGKLLQQDYLLDDDDSADYEAEDDDEGTDSESVDYEYDLQTATTNGTGEAYLLALGDLISSQSFLEFIREDSDILHRHLNYSASDDGNMLTRSKYRALYEKREEKQDAERLLELLLAKRQHLERPKAYGDDGEELIDSRLACVICQVNMREIITWPCKCFAICETCRLSVVAKEIQGCVCCRKEVEGCSKVFLP